MAPQAIAVPGWATPALRNRFEVARSIPLWHSNGLRPSPAGRLPESGPARARSISFLTQLAGPPYAPLEGAGKSWNLR